MLTPLFKKNGYNRATSEEDVLSTHTGITENKTPCRNLVTSSTADTPSPGLARWVSHQKLRVGGPYAGSSTGHHRYRRAA